MLNDKIWKENKKKRCQLVLTFQALEGFKTKNNNKKYEDKNKIKNNFDFWWNSKIEKKNQKNKRTQRKKNEDQNWKKKLD